MSTTQNTADRGSTLNESKSGAIDKKQGLLTKIVKLIARVFPKRKKKDDSTPPEDIYPLF